jgi:hypothetical protein
VLDTDFDPYQAMINMDRNLQNVITAHNMLAGRVQEHEETIAVLLKGLELANANSQALMIQLADLMIEGLNKVK